jgi:bifunctional UDP-N-acetylglucosamine pyrophosphorylase/glucosamine-1-phosphate N-acetyltransferase
MSEMPALHAAPLHVVVLAAGMGKRMRSSLPKVLHSLAGRPLLAHVVETAASLAPAGVHVVYGHGGEVVRERLSHLRVGWVLQSEQLGTGHAVDQALPGVPDDAVVLVLYGDVPLITLDTLAQTVRPAAAGGLGLVTVTLEDASGYGRIVRDDAGAITGIVEHKDASADQLSIREINTGILAVGAAPLRRWLATLDNDNVQGEYYLTDVIARAVADGLSIEAVEPVSPLEVLGVNDRSQLAELERAYQARVASELMARGVTLMDPARLDVRGRVDVEHDVTVDVNVVLEGEVRLAQGVSVGPGVVLKDVSIGPGTVVLAHSVLEGAHIGADCRIGPFARIRPETELGDAVHVGNFVEVKKTRIAPGSKVNHLTYLGDAEIGSGVNVGAGTITCNYDGASKHRTTIGDRAFIGSGVELVAPVSVKAGATIGAGSTITRDAPADTLTVARARQATISGWKRPVKNQS